MGKGQKLTVDSAKVYSIVCCWIGYVTSDNNKSLNLLCIYLLMCGLHGSQGVIRGCGGGGGG